MGRINRKNSWMKSIERALIIVGLITVGIPVAIGWVIVAVLVNTDAS